MSPAKKEAVPAQNKKEVAAWALARDRALLVEIARGDVRLCLAHDGQVRLVVEVGALQRATQQQRKASLLLRGALAGSGGGDKNKRVVMKHRGSASALFRAAHLQARHEKR